jgi:CBS domain-containing protein
MRAIGKIALDRSTPFRGAFMNTDALTEVRRIKQLARKDPAQVHGASGLLAYTTIRQCFDPHPITIRAEASVQAILWRTSACRHGEFPVLSAGDRFLGMIARDAVLEALEIGDDLLRTLVAADLMRVQDNRVTPVDSLLTALGHFCTQDGDCLPVVETKDPDQLVGVLSRLDLLAACRRELIQDASCL